MRELNRSAATEVAKAVKLVLPLALARNHLRTVVVVAVVVAAAVVAPRL
jgi:hypothetical protein